MKEGDYRDQRVTWDRAVTEVPGAWASRSLQRGESEVIDTFRSGLRAHPRPAGPSLWLGLMGQSACWEMIPLFIGLGCGECLSLEVQHYPSSGRCVTPALRRRGACVPTACSISSQVIALMSLLWILRTQGGGLSSLMSELGREVARNGPPAGGCVPPLTAQLLCSPRLSAP